MLRSGAGTSKGELLKLAEDSTGTMLWHGRVFPRSGGEDADVPEAWPAREGLLPHLHEDSEDRFPRAVTCEELEDKDPEGDEGLELRGAALGQHGDDAEEVMELRSDSEMLMTQRRQRGHTRP